MTPRQNKLLPEWGWFAVACATVVMIHDYWGTKNTLLFFWGLVLVLIGIYYLLGGKFRFFVTVPENEFVFHYRGKNLYQILESISGKKLVEGKVVSLVSGEEKPVSWIKQFFGYEFLDFSPTTNIHHFPLKTRVEYVLTGDGSTKMVWSMPKDENGEEIFQSSLRQQIEFTFLLPDMEGGGGGSEHFRVNLQVTCTFFVIYPETVAIRSKGNALMLAHGHLLAHVSGIVAAYSSYEELKAAPRSGDDSILAPMVKEGEESVFNKTLLQATGLALFTIVGGEISTNRAMEEAIEATAIANARAEARKAEARGIADADKMLAEGEAFYAKEVLKTLEESKGTAWDKLLGALLVYLQGSKNK